MTIIGHRPWSADLAAEIILAHPDRQDALLPILHDLQAAFGYLPGPVAELVATALNISRADVHGVISFYRDFRTVPPGRRTLTLCRAEACQARGARELESAICERLGVTFGETTPDGAVTLESAYCLGLCASGPAALLDERPLARLTVEALGRQLEEAGV